MRHEINKQSAIGQEIASFLKNESGLVIIAKDQILLSTDRQENTRLNELPCCNQQGINKYFRILPAGVYPVSFYKFLLEYNGNIKTDCPGASSSVCTTSWIPAPENSM